MTEIQKQPTETLPGRDVKALWFSLRRARPWRTLALVSADGAQVDVLAHQLAQIASLVPQRHVMVIDAVPHKPGHGAREPAGHYGVKVIPEGQSESEILSTFVPEATTALANDALDVALVAVPTPVTHAWAIPLIAVVEAVVLCVELDESRLGTTRETLRYLDPDRLLGSVLIGGD